MSTEERQLIPDVIRVVIPSRGRSAILGDRALSLFPMATVTVAESEMPNYAHLFVGREDQLVSHPDSVEGMGPIRQWILDNFDEECIVMVDDDFKDLKTCLGYRSRKITSPGTAMRILINNATMCKEMGSEIFGYNQAFGDIRKFEPLRPYFLAGWVGGVIGFVGRGLQLDKFLLLRSDVDTCLSALLHTRIILVDQRFAFCGAERWGTPGGNASLRSAQRNKDELTYLQHKWGDYIRVTETASSLLLRTNVERRQKGIRLTCDLRPETPKGTGG